MVEEVNGLRVRPKDVESLKAAREGRFLLRQTLGLRKMLEVSVFEEGGVFEAITQEAVEGYVGDPDECDCYEELMLSGVGDEKEDERENEGVAEVVDGRSDARIGKVAEHGEVWGEEEEREEKPAVVEVLVEEDGGEEESGFFELEEEGRLGEHDGLLYGIVGWNSRSPLGDDD
jgi:hypothetical protein